MANSKYIQTFLMLVLFLSIYYAFTFQVFANRTYVKDPPEFRARLGTILYHTDTPGTAFHTYCYYPTSAVSYPHKAGEYIIKRVSSFKDCEGWLGTAIFKEGWWVSEREKLWWDGDYFNDNIADSTSPSKAI